MSFLCVCVLRQDSTLILTGSADKNIKIWGLDYGDCHKSIFGHDDRYESARVEYYGNLVPLSAFSAFAMSGTVYLFLLLSRSDEP